MYVVVFNASNAFDDFSGRLLWSWTPAGSRAEQISHLGEKKNHRLNKGPW